MRLYSTNRVVNISPGDRYGRFKIVREVPSYSYQRKFECRCDCGERRIVWMTGLRSGSSQSCGCRAKEIRTNSRCNLKHGFLTRKETSGLYHVYHDMMRRCYNPEDAAYPNYGGRGITVCKTWRNPSQGLSKFIAWNGSLVSEHRYQAGKYIDRINNNAGYSPRNCCWSTKSQQNRNTRNTVRVKFKGKDRALVDVYEELVDAGRIPAGVSFRIVYVRMKKGANLQEALYTPYRFRGKLS